MARITFDRNLCKGCGLCAAFCPKKIISRAHGFNALGFVPYEAGPGCTGCGNCALMCPDVVITISHGENESLAG